MLRTLGVRTSLNYGDHSTPLMARRAFVLWLALQCDASSFFWVCLVILVMILGATTNSFDSRFSCLFAVEFRDGWLLGGTRCRLRAVSPPCSDVEDPRLLAVTISSQRLHC